MATTKVTWQQALARGLVIPALPLALTSDGQWSGKYQQALVRYYIDAGAGGLAVGVHSTQFEIREAKHGLFEPVLGLAQQVIDQYADPEFVRIAGVCGDTRQALQEVALIKSFNYHAGLLSLSAFTNSDEARALQHAKNVAAEIPVIGFYLQPAVGGKRFSYDFWRQFCDIDQVIAIKIAPFNRYDTFDVVRAVIDSGRDDITLYTGNDDNIISDLLTPFQWAGQKRYIAGGLLGQWGVWTKRAVELLEEIKQARQSGTIASKWLTLNASLTDANAAVFDAANDYAGCIPGILEVLRRQGLVPSNRCLDSNEKLSPGQAEQLDRFCAAYPEFLDDDFVEANLSKWLDETTQLQ